MIGAGDALAQRLFPGGAKLGPAMAADVVEGADVTIESATDDNGEPELFEEFVGALPGQLADVPRVEPGFLPHVLHLECIECRIGVAPGGHLGQGGKTFGIRGAGLLSGNSPIDLADL